MRNNGPALSGRSFQSHFYCHFYSEATVSTETTLSFPELHGGHPMFILLMASCSSMMLESSETLAAAPRPAPLIPGGRSDCSAPSWLLVTLLLALDIAHLLLRMPPPSRAAGLPAGRTGARAADGPADLGLPAGAGAGGVAKAVPGHRPGEPHCRPTASPADCCPWWEPHRLPKHTRPPGLWPGG